MLLDGQMEVIFIFFSDFGQDWSNWFDIPIALKMYPLEINSIGKLKRGASVIFLFKH